MIHPGGWGGGGGEEQHGSGSRDSWGDNLECLSDASGREGRCPGPSPVIGTLDSLSPSCRLHAGAVRLAQRLWSSEGSSGALAGGSCRSWAQPWERLTTLFSSGSFCRIVLTLFSMPHMGKTEGVPCKYRGMCVTIIDVF